MAQQILVIEYEPRYIERIEEAAASSGYSITVARTGDEAIQALPKRKYDLVVLSTIIPRYSTAQLIRSVRGDSLNASTPIVLTTSGYSGADPRSDAVKIGANDMLVKPYAPPDFVQKVGTLLNLPSAGTGGTSPPVEPDQAETVRLSSKQIFGDLLDDSGKGSTVEAARPADPDKTEPIPKYEMPAETSRAGEESDRPPEKKKRTATDVDQMLADTLAGVRLPSTRKKRKSTGSEDIDKMLENTLSGLETSRTKETPSPQEEPSAEEAEPAQPDSAPSYTPEPAAPEAAEPTEPEPVASEQAAPPPASGVTGGEETAPEEEPFPESLEGPEEEEPVVEAPPIEVDEPPFEGVEDRPSEDSGHGTRLLGGEPPVEEEEAPAEEPDEEEDTSRFGQYVLLEKIATGGMAEVWKARMRGLEGFEKIVAIKKILPHLSDNDEFTEMFVDEAKLAAQLNHNNIIHIYDLGKIDESWFIAMEYIDGFDLKSLLSRGREVGRPLPTPLALFVASKIASALDYAHRKKGFDDQELGLVHRDVSPQNVLISRDGDIKLCDFGIAKAATKASHTQAGALKGKLQYMSPEQAWGRHIDHRSDIFATAAVLFEMLAGRKLFTGDSELSVLDQVREAQVPSPSVYNDSIPQEVDEIVMKGLEKDPGARYQTAGEMARAIDSILYSYKPAPTSGDLTLYVSAIENPDEHAMPAIATATAPEVTTAPPPEKPPEPPPEPEFDPGETQRFPMPAPIPEAPAPPEPDMSVGEETISVASEDAAPAGSPVFASSSIGGGESKKSRVVPIAIVILLVVVTAAVGAVIMMRKGEPGGPQSDAAAGMGANTPAATTSSPVVVPDPSNGENDVAGGLTEEQLAEEQLGETASPGLGEDDLALIDQAVRDRIEAERRRLERESQQSAAQEQARRPEPREEPSTPPAQPPAASQPQTSTPPPAPSSATTTTSEPASEPATPAATTPAENPPATATEPPAGAEPPAEPSRPAVKRGDLVEPGTTGLTDPRLVSLKKVPYPPIARRNRVEGLVIVRALISEDGKVLETELLRGVSQNVGLNEAAMEMVRGGKFEAGSYQGVAVRSWKTIPIPFKME